MFVLRSSHSKYLLYLCRLLQLFRLLSLRVVSSGLVVVPLPVSVCGDICRDFVCFEYSSGLRLHVSVSKSCVVVCCQVTLPSPCLPAFWCLCLSCKSEESVSFTYLPS